jgi:calcium permeable stress-gated cation channel
MFLSTDHYSMRISPAPQPGDIQWRNVAKSQNQVDTRKTVADMAFYVGALFWSVLVSGIAAISNLDNLAVKYPWISDYQDTYFYSILNSYLASMLLIVVLALLPFIFDFSARWYEGIKLESRIQESVMTRFFFYQLVNVFVSVGLGSILTNLASILEKPEQIFTILGVAVPSFSVYFTNLIIVKTFTAVPLEMLRPWPLIQVLSLGSIINEKTCSWRYLHTGIFAAPEMLYSWYYPSLLMVLMIINIYACISPLLLPFALIYFVFVFYMYKYQLLYIFQNKYQAGGMMWIRVFRYRCVCI